MKAKILALALFALLCHLLPANAQQVGPVYCSQSAFFDGTGPQRLVTGTQGNRIFICGYDITGSAPAIIQLKTGTGTNCGNGTANLTPAWNVVAGASNFGNANFVGIGPVPPLIDVCVTSAPGAQIMLYYSQQ